MGGDGGGKPPKFWKSSNSGGRNGPGGRSRTGHGGFRADDASDDSDGDAGTAARKYVRVVGGEKVEKEPLDNAAVKGVAAADAAMGPVEASRSRIEKLMERQRRLRESGVDGEDDVFRKDLEACPEETMESYEKRPVEEFGKFILMSMGWKEGENDKTTSFEPKLRQPRLGLGATPLSVEEAKKKRKADQLRLKKASSESAKARSASGSGQGATDSVHTNGHAGDDRVDRSANFGLQTRGRSERDADRRGSGEARSGQTEDSRRRDQNRSRSRYSERDHERDGDRDRDRDRTRDRTQEHDRDRARRRDYDHDRDRDRKRYRDSEDHLHRSRSGQQDRDRERNRDRDRERYRDRDSEEQHKRDRRNRYDNERSSRRER